MIIYTGGKELLLDILDSSYRYREIMGEHSLTLYFSLPEFVEIDVGAYCIYMEDRYTLTHPASVTENGKRNFEYVLILEAEQYKLSKYKIRNTVDRRLKFSYTAKPIEHLQLIVDNLNARDSGWRVGRCVEGVEVSIAYNHVFCSEALKMLADALETEYEIVGKVVNLGKVEYNHDSPLKLSYGKGKGFKTGVKRDNSDDSLPVDILFVQGGEKNIDFSKYGSKDLLLPKNQQLVYEGRTYISDSEGYSIRRVGKPVTHNEDSLDCSEIYPKRVGKISAVVLVDKEKNFYDIIDDSIPNELNYEECVIEGETMTVIFQSGMLAGKEFEVKYIHISDSVEGKASRRFEIVPQEIDGQTMPSENFKPIIGDTYAVFGCMLPDAYICNDADQSGASWDMFREAVKYHYEHEDQRFSFTGELDGIWSKKDWLNIGGKIILGGYVRFTADFTAKEGVLIRIRAIKDYINKPFSPEIELSNVTSGSSIGNDLRKIEETEVVIDDRYREALQFTKRRFRDAKETAEMLQNALLHFSGAINPITIQTMSLLVGDESLQFRFVNNKTTPVRVSHVVSYNSETKILTSPAGIVQHMTIGINSLTSQHAVSEYKFWDIEKFDSPVLVDVEKKYYLYVKVNKTGTVGVFYLSETAIAMEGVSGYYHFLMGILNSEYEGERSFVELYGFTEILPGRVTTDRVVSADGLNYLDFVNNAFRVGNDIYYLDYNTRGDGKIRLKGSLIQSESGDESPVGCFRGAYNNSYTYYWGDEVVYNDGTGISTYRFISKEPKKGVKPSDSLYWEVVAQRGVGIKDTDVLYAISDSNTIAPTSSWQTESPEWVDGKYIWSKTKVIYTDGSEMFSDASCITGGKGHTGNGIKSIVEQYYLSSSSTSLVDGTWSGTRPVWKNGWYFWTRSEIIYTSGDKITTDAICVTGEKGASGDYYEYRYAVNGSRSTAPDLDKTSANPSGWSTEMPAVGELQYLWFIVAKKSSTGDLLINWSNPVRQTPYDGIDGAIGPAVVFRGVYSKDETYYGNSKRVDVVKYNGVYYVARTDVNSFQNKLPTNVSFWNDFGAQFESIATGLLLAENANIANFIFRNECLTSQAKTNNIYNILFNGIDGTGHLAAGNLKWDAAGNILMKGRIGTPYEVIKAPSGTYIYRDISNADVVVEYTNSDVQAKKLVITGDVYNNMVLTVVVRSLESPEYNPSTGFPIGFNFTIRTGQNGNEWASLVCFKGSSNWGRYSWNEYLNTWIELSKAN